MRDEAFQPHVEVGVDGVGTLYIGQDLRLYRKTTGLTQVIAPCSPVKDTEPEALLDGVRWEDFPPLGELRHLYETFLRQYDREVMFVIGKKWDDSGWFYMVPEQEGTAGSIDWEDKEGMEELFAAEAQWIGTCHIHPGASCTPSGTDIENWKKPEQSGLHIIFGRRGDFSITGSASGFSMLLLEGHIRHSEVIEVALRASMDRPLKELLRIPPPPPPVEKWAGFHRGREPVTSEWVEDLWKKKHEEGDNAEPERSVDFAETFWEVGALICEEKDIRLRRIRYDGKVYLMTEDQFEEAREEHPNGLPASTILKIERRRK